MPKLSETARWSHSLEVQSRRVDRALLRRLTPGNPTLTLTVHCGCGWNGSSIEEAEQHVRKFKHTVHISGVCKNKGAV